MAETANLLLLVQAIGGHLHATISKGKGQTVRASFSQGGRR
jgi:hypothetical protein